MSRGFHQQVPVAESTWMDDAACAGMNNELFVPDKGNAPWCYERARQICTGCPVRERCLDFALTMDERRGMWGGLTPQERELLIELGGRR